MGKEPEVKEDNLCCSFLNTYLVVFIYLSPTDSEWSRQIFSTNQ